MIVKVSCLQFMKIYIWLQIKKKKELMNEQVKGLLKFILLDIHLLHYDHHQKDKPLTD